MARPRKTDESVFYDIFATFTVADQKIALRVMERLVTEREKDEQRAAKAAKENGQ